MNKFALLLVTSALIGSCFAQNAKTPQVDTVSPAKSIQAGPLQITAVDAKYDTWGWQQLSIGQRSSITGWGIRVHLVNTTDKSVSEYIGPDGLLMIDNLGKRYSLQKDFMSYFPLGNLGQLSEQSLAGDLFIFSSGFSVEIRDDTSAVGKLTSIYNGVSNKTVLNLELSPKKGVTLVFVFDSPQESKPQTLAWPKANPIDLR